MEKESDGDSTVKSNNSMPVAPSSSSSSSRKLKREIEQNNDELSWDMLDIIAKKLDIDNLFQFGAVSKSWRIFHKIYWKDFMASQAPLLVQTSFAMNSYSLYNIREQKIVLNYCYLERFRYAGYSNGNITMVDVTNNKLLLINPFTRRIKEISTLAIKGKFPFIGSNFLFASVKDSKEFIIMGIGNHYQSLHVYHSRNSSWVTYSSQDNSWMVVNCLVFRNIVYVITNKARIGVLNLNSSSLKFLRLKNTPKVNNFHIKLVNHDGELLMVDFESQQQVDVYKIDFSTRAYVKLETVGELAIFYGWTSCYALRKPVVWGYKNNFMYHLGGLHVGCEVYFEGKLFKSILATGLPPYAFISGISWVDWCFRHQHDEVDYSIVE
ncbi:hypothetical protein VNO78_15915 [Psophocarpus tetragonolobus]|uniref:KIB1-4 beta-propeller domain-containing protein n=1 Tax=Psophocarpus tetragonolobus TaxID=3891 RepID=A0AAN9SK33_PSOTE